MRTDRGMIAGFKPQGKAEFMNEILEAIRVAFVRHHYSNVNLSGSVHRRFLS